MKKIFLFLVIFPLTGIYGQDFQFYKSLIDIELDPEEVAAMLVDHGYEVTKIWTENDCIIYK